MSASHLDNALADFSGYLAIDEVYDGPFCILSVVDNRRYNRLAFAVLDHAPTNDDVRIFLQEFKGQLENRQYLVRGITTDGSPLYPKVFNELWPNIPHQVCEFHVLKEITRAILHALAKLRKDTTANTAMRSQRGSEEGADRCGPGAVSSAEQRQCDPLPARSRDWLLSLPLLVPFAGAASARRPAQLLSRRICRRPERANASAGHAQLRRLSIRNSAMFFRLPSQATSGRAAPTASSQRPFSAYPGPHLGVGPRGSGPAPSSIQARMDSICSGWRRGSVRGGMSGSALPATS